MAFLIDNFSTIGSNSRKGEAPQQFSYESATDNIATIKAGNYFGEVAFQMSASDMIAVIATDGMAFMQIVTSDPVTGSVAVDSNVISNQGGSDSSASFHNVFKLADFPVQDATTITLENGVNYMVYIEGPVTSVKEFVFASPYEKGGSLIYMGGEGVLLWNYTGGGNWIGTASAQLGGPFTLQGFDVNSPTGAGENTVKIQGVDANNRFDEVIIRRCTFSNFGLEFFQLLNIDRVVLEDVLTDEVTLESDGGILVNIMEVKMRGCEIESLSQFGAALRIVPLSGAIAISHYHLQDCDFTLNTANEGAIDVEQISDFDGVFIISDCTVRDKNNLNAEGFFTESIGNIQKIEVGAAGNIKVTTRLDHNLSAGDKVALFGTVTYNAQDLAVDSSPAPTAKTFEVLATYSIDNFGGGFVKGSLNPFSNPGFSVSNSLGFEGQNRQGNALTSTNTQTTIGTGAAIKFTYSAGTIQGPINGLPNDFIISDYLNLELKYTGHTVINAKVRLIVASENTSAGIASVFFRPNNDTARDTKSSRWNLANDGTFAVESIIRLSPGETVTPYINFGNTLVTTFTDINFTIAE